MPGKPQTGGFDLVGVVYLAIVFAVMFIPVLLVRSQPPPSADSDHDDGGGSDPPPPSPFPSPPSGGKVLLPDAEQSLVRLRDHGRLAERHRRRKRTPAHDPARTRPPVRAP